MLKFEDAAALCADENKTEKIVSDSEDNRIEPKPKKTRIEPESELNSDSVSREYSVLSDSVSGAFSDNGLGYQRFRSDSNSGGTCRNILKWLLVVFLEILIFAGFSAIAIYLGTLDKSQDEYGVILFLYSLCLAFACK